MSEIEIALAQAYLRAAGQDPVGALIRSVRDLALTRDLVSPGYVRGVLPGLGDADDDGAERTVEVSDAGPPAQE